MAYQLLFSILKKLTIDIFFFWVVQDLRCPLRLKSVLFFAIFVAAQCLSRSVFWYHSDLCFRSALLFFSFDLKVYFVFVRWTPLKSSGPLITLSGLNKNVKPMRIQAALCNFASLVNGPLFAFSINFTPFTCPLNKISVYQLPSHPTQPTKNQPKPSVKFITLVGKPTQPISQVHHISGLNIVYTHPYLSTLHF